jgi:hypothetical protein
VGEHNKRKLSVWQRLDNYAKFLVALAGALMATAAQLGIMGVPNTWQEWGQIAVYYITAAGVRQTENKDHSNEV